MTAPLPRVIEQHDVKEKNTYPCNHLQTLLDGFVDLSEVKNCNLTFKGLSDNSKKVHEEYLFLASAGTAIDCTDGAKKMPQHGIAYAGEAINRGAKLIVWEPTAELNEMPDSCAAEDGYDVPLIRVASLHEKTGEIAARFYQHPSHDLNVTGITGTNGKTSTAHFIAQLIHLIAVAAEKSPAEKCAVIGTLGNGLYGELEESTHTTPGAVQLQALMAAYRKQNIANMVMEVSSHALAQGRVNGVEFDTAVFTNLSRDHLDYHGDMKNYAHEKLKLFQFASLQRVVVNLDDPFADTIINSIQLAENNKKPKLVTYSKKDNKADYFADNIVMNTDGISFSLSVSDSVQDNLSESYLINSRLLGAFNIENILAAVAVLHQQGYALKNIICRISGLTTVPGRMEKIVLDNKQVEPFTQPLPLIVIDYAHTPDALEKGLKALKPHACGKLYCIFGCGGDRDKGKRPLMAKAAEQYADRIMVTSDNPRTEQPQQIIAESISGFAHPEKILTAIDREQAIKEVLHSATADDVILIAGKGHEDYQEIQGKTIPFSDKACVLSVLSDRTLSLCMSQVALALGEELSGKDQTFSQVSINSRTLEPGDLFVAIRGDNFDAHQFIKQAAEKGACGLIIEQSAEQNAEQNVEQKTDLDLAQIRVPDSRMALAQIALLWRKKFALPMIAITGSCGKTTVKEMTAAIMQAALHASPGQPEQVLATRGNFNNDIGVPLTLLRLSAAHKAAVIEIGASHSGEIKQLVALVQPDVAVITNAGHAHIEGFGSLQGVAEAKAEIYSGLKNNGTAVINADDCFAELWLAELGLAELGLSEQGLAEQRQSVTGKTINILTFGLNKTADISADYKQTAEGIELTLKTPLGNQLIFLTQFGQHNIYNALTAAAVSIASGCSLIDIKKGLEAFKNAPGRLEQKTGFNGSFIFDDTYNANPDSVKAGVDALLQRAQQENIIETLLILGDMGELGKDSQQLHYQLGIDIAASGIKKLFTVGKKTHETYKAFLAHREGQNEDLIAMHFLNKDELIKHITQLLVDKSMVLVKGSRSMGMEAVVNALVEEKVEEKVEQTVEQRLAQQRIGEQR